MTSIVFVEPLIDAAIATLQANLPAQIAAYNAQAAAVVELVEPSEYVFGAADPLILAAGPVVEVAAVQGTTGLFTVDRAAFDHDPRLTVCVWHEGGELSTAYRTSLGLARCIIETLTQDGAFGAQVEVSNQTGVEWRTDAIPTDPTDDGRAFRKWRVPVLIIFRLEAVEAFG